MKKHFLPFLFFSRNEQRGILLLSFLVLGVMALKFFCWDGDAKAMKQTARQLRQDSLLADSLRKLRTRKGKYASYRKRQEVSLFAFDPNQVDSLTLCQLGLPSWMAGNLLKYRRAGGLFKSAEDFGKLYGLNGERYESLRPYIRIDKAYVERVRAARRSIAPRDTIHSLLLAKDTLRKIEKYAPGTVIELNGADTTALKHIPGIGSGIAGMIVRYREQLGGFYRLEQLAEINLDYHRLQPWFSICADSIRRINLNRASIHRLHRHPYINFYQAKVVVEYRRRHGDMKSLRQLSLYDEFTDKDFERLSHYICFE